MTDTWLVLKVPIGERPDVPARCVTKAYLDSVGGAGKTVTVELRGSVISINVLQGGPCLVGIAWDGGGSTQALARDGMCRHCGRVVADIVVTGDGEILVAH